MVVNHLSPLRVLFSGSLKIFPWKFSQALMTLTSMHLNPEPRVPPPLTQLVYAPMKKKPHSTMTIAIRRIYIGLIFSDNFRPPEFASDSYDS